MIARLPPHPKWMQEAHDDLLEYEKTHPPVLSPCVDQTEKDVEAYYRNAPVGAVAVVRHTQGRCLRYDVTEIEGGKRGRVYVRGFSAFYAKHGKNCFHPKGQTRLVVHTEQVLAWAAAHPRGEAGVRCWRRDEEGLL